MTGRERCLDAAKSATTSRAASYGAPEDLFKEIAARWARTLGVLITARQVAICMIDLKLARAMHAKADDTAIDIAGYAACLFEIDEKAAGPRAP